MVNVKNIDFEVVTEGLPGKLVYTAPREINCRSLVIDHCTSKININYEDNTTFGLTIMAHFVPESVYYSNWSIIQSDLFKSVPLNWIARLTD